MVSFDWRDRGGVWRPLMPDAGVPPFSGKLATAFPLIPFGGRLRGARLNWQGRDVRVPEHPLGSGLVLHGDGARRAWSVTEHGTEYIEMRLDWPSPDWPFNGSARIAFRLDENGLHHRQSLSVPDRPWPFLLGWHPFFRVTDSTRLTLQARRIAVPDQHGFPRSFEVSDGADGLRSRDLRPTRIYDLIGCDREIALDHEDISLKITLSQACRYVTVYAPADAPCIAIEPLSGLIDNDRFLGVDAELFLSFAVHGHDNCL